VPLVLSSGAGAAARITLGLAVLSGMVASTLLAVLFVPSLFVVFQRLETRLRGPKPVQVHP
jgi:HAE1 family hydrophobic/amphiphilic exporter-1